MCQVGIEKKAFFAICVKKGMIANIAKYRYMEHGDVNER